MAMNDGNEISGRELIVIQVHADGEGRATVGGSFREGLFQGRTGFTLIHVRPLASIRRLDAWSWVSSSLDATVIRGTSVRPRKGLIDPGDRLLTELRVSLRPNVL
jgi:hypothetical protein